MIRTTPLRLKLFVGLCMVMLALVLLLRWQFQNYDRAAIQSGEQRASLLAQAFSAHSDSTIRLVDNAAISIARLWVEHPIDFNLQTNLVLKTLTGVSLQAAITDEKGILIYSNLTDKTDPIDLSDRAHIRVHLGSAADALYISSPVKGRVSGKWSIQFSRPIFKADRLIGVVVISVDPGFYFRFYEKLPLGEYDSILLAKDDGSILVRSPQGEDFYGQRVTSSPPVIVGAPLSGTYRAKSQLDGVERIFSWQKSRQNGVIVVVGLSVSEIMADTLSNRRLMLLATFLFAVMVMVIAIFSVRASEAKENRAKLLEESNKLLEERVAERTFDLTASNTALAESQSHLHQLMQNLNVAILVYGPDQRLRFQNQRASDLIGLTPEQLSGDLPFDSTWCRVNEDMTPALETEPLVRRVFATGKPVVDQVVGIYRANTQTYVWLLGGAFPELTSDGQIAQVVVSYKDMTERKVAQDKQRKQEQYFSKILSNIGDPVFVKDEHNCFVLANDAFCALLGIPGSKILGKEMAEDLLTQEMQEFLKVDRQVLIDGQERLVEEVITPPGELSRIVQTKKTLFTDQSGSKFIIGVMRDITESKKMESKLRESQKLEAIGQLTGGLAHDFNNLLGIVVGNLDLIQEQLKGASPRLRRQFDTARDAALRGAEVTRSLLAVARRQPLEVQSLEINTLLSEMLPLVRASGGTMMTLTAHLVPELLLARIDSGGLSNAILNLAINARDAMQAKEGEHRLNLHTRRARMAPGNDLNLSPGDYAVVEVSDNGPGMTDAVRARVFEPFFTTKGVGKGTGLGLAMVLGYTEQLGGTARIDSTLGQGTTVSLYLPLDAAAQARADNTEAARLGALQGLHVLDRAPEDEYDALVAEAARVCGTPIALVSLIDENRQWFKSKVGLQAEETSRVDAFCAHVVLKPDQTMVVPDTVRDLRFSDNPLVTGTPYIRFYAGVPLIDAAGYALGTLCVIDRVPRRLDDSQIEQLEVLAARVSELLRQRAPQEAQASGFGASRFGDLKAHTPDALGRLRVLVVDDEEGLCELACTWLGALGYDTVSVLSPKEALVQLESSHFDVLFTDVVMPGDLDGVSLARQALVRQPGLRVLLTSGYARDLLESGNAPGPLLNKPYRKKDLAGAFKALFAEATY